jgi:hypothetical protein
VTAEKKAGVALSVNVQYKGNHSPPVPGRQSSHKKFKFKLFRGVTGMYFVEREHFLLKIPGGSDGIVTRLWAGRSGNKEGFM